MFWFPLSDFSPECFVFPAVRRADGVKVGAVGANGGCGLPLLPARLSLGRFLNLKITYKHGLLMFVFYPVLIQKLKKQ